MRIEGEIATPTNIQEMNAEAEVAGIHGQEVDRLKIYQML